MAPLPKPLEGISAKFERAYESIKNLDSEMRAFVTAGDYKPFAYFENDHREYVFTIKGDPAVPLRFAVLAGEIVHHLRSSLDHLVTALVERNGARPLNTHQFPICKDRQKFERSINSGCIQGVSASAADRIEGAQPYHASDPTTVPIAALDELDIRDKHRLLIVTVAAASLGETVLTGINEEMMRSGKREPLPAIINFVHSKGAVCEKGIEYFRMVFAEPAPHFHGDAEFKVQVAFEKIGRVNYMPVTVALEAAHRLTGDLIDSFIPEF